MCKEIEEGKGKDDAIYHEDDPLGRGICLKGGPVDGGESFLEMGKVSQAIGGH